MLNSKIQNIIEDSKFSWMIKYKNQCQEQCQFSQVKFEVKAIFTWFSRKTQVVVFTLLYSFTLSIFLIFYEHAISAFKLSIALKFWRKHNQTLEYKMRNEKKFTKHAYNKLVYKDITTNFSWFPRVYCISENTHSR